MPANGATKADERNERELDEALAETFPASDPPANTVETGIRVGDALPVVADNREASRFEIVIDGKTAVLIYERRPGAIVLRHTEVPVELRGKQLGERLAETALRSGRAEGLSLIIECPFVREYVRRHPASTP